MQIICKSGTTIQCEDFEAIDSGVLFYQQTSGRVKMPEGDEEEVEEEESEEDMKEERASGFIPLHEVQFVLPDEMVQQPRQQTSARSQSRPAQSQHGGGMAQQQQMQQHPGHQGGR